MSNCQQPQPSVDASLHLVNLTQAFVEQTVTANHAHQNHSITCVSPWPQAPEHHVQKSLHALSVASQLQRWVDAPLALFDAETGALLHQTLERPPVDWNRYTELICAVGRGNRAQALAEEDPLLLYALPVHTAEEHHYVAVAAYVTRPIHGDYDVTRAAQSLGCQVVDLFAWCLHQRVTLPNMVERICEMLVAKLDSDRHARRLEIENENLATHISATFEEISLMYRLTHSLKLSSNKEDLASQALGWLAAAVPAESLLIQFLPESVEQSVPTAAVEPHQINWGPCRLCESELVDLVNVMKLGPQSAPLVLNRLATEAAGWSWPSVHEMVLVPITEGDRLFGWLAAVNHNKHGEFTSVEANLLFSVGTILGIHSANVGLYKQQAAVLADVVRAMVSAIDAKDPYTRGHSDRVARVAARLTQEMGMSQDATKTMYLAGLLHDIGKIGIDDGVLRKPGKLTDAEFEHVKRHAEIGYRILRDLRQLQPMLPIVLHHHEAWDGSGYPHALAGENIPLLARVCAVADAYDAMASDRPYRPGMPDEKLDAIIRGGAGKQWDAQVVEAFFRAREDIREISRREATADELLALQLT
ncbi:MAG: HD-GYP domain-containing protein [Planctomycetes bacterium]|nr:HD-GYP domain-containing protein [Planctomycetota bacterium]